MNSHQSESPVRCAKGCGFFGTAGTMNMCSKCYGIHHLKEDQSAVVTTAVENSLISKLLFNPLLEKEKFVEVAAVAAATTTVAESSTKAVNRCGSCNKKVGVVGFKCRCGSTFCGSHRYPEEHSCTHDYKVAGREAIAKANPPVVADKLQRI